MVQYLVQHKVNLDAQDNDGDTGLHLCCMMKSRAADLFSGLSGLSGLLSRLPGATEVGFKEYRKV